MDAVDVFRAFKKEALQILKSFESDLDIDAVSIGAYEANTGRVPRLILLVKENGTHMDLVPDDRNDWVRVAKDYPRERDILPHVKYFIEDGQKYGLAGVVKKILYYDGQEVRVISEKRAIEIRKKAIEALNTIC